MPRGYKSNGEKLIPPNWKGKRRSLKSREKLSQYLTGRTRPELQGDKNPLWKGGISKDINKYSKNYRRNKKEKLAGRKMPEQCEICGVLTKDLKRGLCYDHNHKTMEFRGWICTRCNTAIGLVKENKEILFSMVEYLENNGTKTVKTLNGLA